MTAALGAFLAWLNLELWGPLWPNLAASVIWTWPVLAWHHVRLRQHVTASNDELREQILDLLQEMRADLSVIHEVAEQWEQLRDRVDEHISLCHREGQ